MAGHHLRGERRLKDCCHSPHCLHLRIAPSPFERNTKLAFEMPHLLHLELLPCHSNGIAKLGLAVSPRFIENPALSFLGLGVDLSRFCAAPRARLSHLPFKSDRAFPA